MTLIRRENHLLDVQFGIIIDVELSRVRQSEVRAARTIIERTGQSCGLRSNRLPAGSARRAFKRVEMEFAHLKRILRFARHRLRAKSPWIRPKVAQARLHPPSGSVPQKGSWTRQPLVMWWIAIHHP
jgi:hypothetical protein